MTPKICRQINDDDDPYEDKDYVKKATKFSTVFYFFLNSFINL